MVRIKLTPKHAAVTPPKCVVYVYKNPIRNDIYWRREYFLKDQQARDEARLVDYKKHVHRPPKDYPATTQTAKTTDSWYNVDGS